MKKVNQNDDDDDRQKHNIINPKVEPITENGIYFIRKQCIEIQKKCKRFLVDAKIYDKTDNIMRYMISHPLLLISFIIIIATVVLPIFLFTIFVIINVAIAFTSFIIIEVMLLMIGMTVLCCTMFLIFSTVLVTGVCFILSVYIICVLFSLVKKKLCCK